MSLVVITPQSPSIDLDLVKSALRIGGSSEDALLESYVSTACAHLSGPEGVTGRSIWSQTLELRLTGFEDEIELPYGPVTSVSSVKYLDAAGYEITLSSSAYALRADDVLAPISGGSWPSVRGDIDGIKIRYVAGFASVPAPITSAALLMVGDLYRNRETVSERPMSEVPMSATIRRLISTYCKWPV